MCVFYKYNLGTGTTTFQCKCSECMFVAAIVASFDWTFAVLLVVYLLRENYTALCSTHMAFPKRENIVYWL